MVFVGGGFAGPQVPVFGNAADMIAQLSYLGSLVRSSEVWGVFSKVSGPFGPDKYESVQETVRWRGTVFFWGEEFEGQKGKKEF